MLRQFIYVGSTDNIEVRLNQHLEQKNNSYVSSRLPFRVVYVETFPTRDAAKRAEKQIKGWSRIKKEALIRGGIEEVVKICNT